MTGQPAVARIVYPGGSASMAQVWVGDRQLHGVVRIEIDPIDVAPSISRRYPVTVRITVEDPEFAIEALLDPHSD